MQFSANLGFLWADLPLTDAIRAAKVAGFDAVECHWPYAFSSERVVAALAETGLPMLGLNTRRGNLAAGENGLAAVPGRETEARAAIDEAIAYAAAVGARNIHVMAGVAKGAEARAVFLSNLAYACEAAKPLGLTILIEPLNRYDAPGYFLTNTDQALGIISETGLTNLKLMFDCYHVQLMEGDITNRLTRLLPVIGHIQIAAVPDRGPPDHGELDYGYVFEKLRQLGWSRPLGAEYIPGTGAQPALEWMRAAQRRG
jgi:hydroxypyruvate isomerase